MAIGDEVQPGIAFVDWVELYNRTDDDDEAIIDGIAFRGRWTAIASPAKAGKSTILLALAVAAAKDGHQVIYVDAEMGRNDVLDRVESWMHLKAEDLVNLHYCDLPPKLDNVQGATALWHAVEEIDPDLVVIDGLNGVVNGAENDDTTWRDMYEWAISPLKQRHVAIVSADNLGKAKDNGPRGSSVKLDKADAILRLERTDIGVKLTATHRRTATYPLELEYKVTDAGDEGPAMKVERVDSGSGYPPETNRIVALLDELDAPTDISKRAAQALLRAHEGKAPGNDKLPKILAWRRMQAETIMNATCGQVVPVVPGTTQDHRDHPEKVVPDQSGPLSKTPGRSVVPDGWSTTGPPPSEPQTGPGPPRGLEGEKKRPPPPTAEEVGI